MKKGKFIVFEGTDGAGKSTQVQLLCDRLKEEQIAFYNTFEPTYSPFGSLIRNILGKRIKTDEQTIAALFVADRLDHIQNDVNGMLHYINSGVHVIADRYYLSSYAYHSTHVDLDWVIAANSICADLLRPDLILFFDLLPEKSMERLQKGRKELDIFETKERLTLVRNNYLKAIEKVRAFENIRMLDADNSVQKIEEEVWNIVSKLVKK